MEKVRKELQDTMSFLGAISSGIEEFLGGPGPAKSVAHLAGKRLGKKCSENEQKTEDILEAVEISRNILRKNHFLWQIEPWKKKKYSDYVFTNDDGNKVVKLVFRDCMIRQALYRYGHYQQSSLCHMMFGFFSGLTESVLGLRSELKIIHAGQNACLKELILRGKK